jgi:hypothetical protein
MEEGKYPALVEARVAVVLEKNSHFCGNLLSFEAFNPLNGTVP